MKRSKSYSAGFSDGLLVGGIVVLAVLATFVGTPSHPASINTGAGIALMGLVTWLLSISEHQGSSE
jgi:hypothetical protein